MSEHTIRYRRPETPWSLSRMTVPSAQQAQQQIDRLTALGYAIAEVLPPLEAVATGDGGERAGARIE